MASEYDALLAPPPETKSEYDALLLPPVPVATQVVQPSQTEPSQSREAIRPTVSLPSLTDAIFGGGGQAVQNAQDVGLELVKGIPQMVEQLPGYAYQGMKFAAGGPEEKAQVIEQALAEGVPQGRQIASDIQAPVGSREWFRGAAGIGMLAVPALSEFGPSLTRAIFGRSTVETPPIQIPETPVISEQAAAAVKPPVQDRQLLVMPERRFTLSEPQPTEAELATANKELAPVTEPPSATAEPFPSLLRSAEDQRRVAQQQEPPKVREAISLDELRLMRERSELQLQNDLAKRATGNTHPAVDERLGQIDEELTNIANRELQTQGGGEINATQERQIAESGQPEYQGNGEIGTPTETGGRGSVEPSTEVAGQEAVVPTEIPQSPAAVGERVQSGQFGKEGYTAVETKPENIPTAEKPPIQTSEGDPHVSTIANRFVEERAAKGEIGEIAPGQGYSTQDLVQRGLKMSPEEINQHVSDLMQGGGDPIKQGMAVRAEEARLSQRSTELSKAADANPSSIDAKLAADNAFKDLQDFHNGPVARLKQNWHAQGMGLQGEIPVDLSTYNGMREAWLKDTGEAPPPSVESTLRRTAQKVATSVADENGAMSRLGQKIETVTSRQKLPTAEEVRNNIMERLKQMPCPT